MGKDIPLTEEGDTLDIDGIVFDADGFGGTLEQAVGGLSIFRGAVQCNFEWAATAVALDSDTDGWSDTAELRLGSNPNDLFSSPEHHEVPTTALMGPDVCNDLIDNDGDELIDADDPNCVQ